MRLICYLSNGFPSLEKTVEIAGHYVAAGCDTIQIDLPARDPYLEGEFIQWRMRQALANCADYGEYMKTIAEIRCHHPGLTVFLLIYEHTLEEIGLETFVSFCRREGIINLTVIGLSSPEIRNRLLEAGFKISSYVRRHFPDAEIQAARETNGFVYLQVKPEFPTAATLKDDIAFVRKAVGPERPVYCGVGIQTVKDIQQVIDAGADGAFVGTTILKVAEHPNALVDVIRLFKAPILRKDVEQ